MDNMNMDTDIGSGSGSSMSNGWYEWINTIFRR